MLTRYPIGVAVTILAIAIAGRRLYFLERLITVGKPAPNLKLSFRRTAAREVTEVIGQKRLLRWTIPGIAHALTFWGFNLLILTIIEAWGALFSKTFAIPLIGHASVIGFSEDAFAVLVLLSLLVFAVIRMVQSPARAERQSRFFGSHTGAAWLVLGMILLVIVTLLLYRAAQVNTGDFPYGWWAFASHGLGNALHPLGVGTNRVLETVFLDANVIVICSFLVIVAYSKHLHIFLAPLNVGFARDQRLGALSTPTIDPEAMDEDTVFGVGVIEQFSWKQLLDFGTCTECGRCQSVCPAWATGKPLSPKLVIMNLRDELFSSSDRLVTHKSAEPAAANPLLPNVIDPDALWSCTTCGACVQECPVDIAHVDSIMDMRRYQVLMESEFPSEGGLMLRNIENRGDPWGLGAPQRLAWTEALDFEIPVVTDTIPDDVEYLYWVGCAGALDGRAKAATQATAKLLNRAGVKFAILGPRETCTGDPARRMGNEYLYQTQAQQNIETLNASGVRKIVASCAHCFNAIANEYPALGGQYEVVHHSQLLADLVESGRIVPGEFGQKVTFHDPCYLGRHNKVFDEPRSLLESLEGSEFVEMDRSRESSFCCGAGGARMWLEEDLGTRINVERTNQAVATGATTVATACPYCRVMLDDGVKSEGHEESVEVLDIAQLLERSMAGETPTS
ncbi:MAG TPA: (Fe-S)-binding protein [Acidimicrobiales bacterium]|nr:(Fe-S)-binding protein [Acidimicrobiales bacterium]